MQKQIIYISVGWVPNTDEERERAGSVHTLCVWLLLHAQLISTPIIIYFYHTQELQLDQVHTAAFEKTRVSIAHRSYFNVFYSNGPFR